MAKISANGATEMARIKSVSSNGTEFLWVMCSDGRVLRRLTSYGGTGYSVYRRGWKGDKTQAVLIEMAQACGHKVVPAK